MADYEISAKITADSSDFKHGMEEAQKSTKGFSSSIKDVMNKSSSSIGSVLGKGGLIATGVAVAVKSVKKLYDAFKEGQKDLIEHEKKQKILSKTIESTGASAWTTAEELNKMADSIQEVTNYASDDITQLQTVLLGFKNIGKENFEETTNAILDMATVMGMDLTNATQAVAKALDDPIKGLGSLSRQGFAFTESQKALIQSFMDVGDVASAQKIILDELNGTYGGAAKAGADASTQLKNEWKDLRKEFARNISLKINFDEAKENAKEAVSAIKKYLQEMADATQRTEDLIKAQENIRSGKGSDKDRALTYEYEINQQKLLLKNYYAMLEVETDPKIRGSYQSAIQQLNIEISKQEVALMNAEKMIAKQEEENRLIAEKKAKEQAESEATEARIQKENEYIKANETALEKEIQRITLEAKLANEQVDVQDILNAKMDSYISLINDSDGLIREDYPYAIKRLEDVRKAQEELNSSLSEGNEEISEFSGKAENIKIKLTFGQQLKKSIREMTPVLKEAVSKINETFSKVGSFVGDVFSKAVNVFKNAIELNPDEILDNLLVVEDKILTFFTETIPKIPSIIESAMGSIDSMLERLFTDFDIDTIYSAINKVIKVITKYAPKIIKVLTKLIVKIADSLIDSLIEFFTSSGFTEMMNALVKIITELISGLLNHLPELVTIVFEVIVAITKGVIEMLPQLVVEIIKALPSIIKSLVEGIWDLIVGAFKSVGGWFKRGWDWIGDKLGWWATGTNNVNSGLAVVGEQGPELVDFHGGERIYNAQNTRQILSNASGSSGSTMNITFNNTKDTTAYTVMRELKQEQRRMSIMGVL